MLSNSTNNSFEIRGKEKKVEQVALILNLRLHRAMLPVILFIGIVAYVEMIGNVLIFITYVDKEETSASLYS